MCLRLIEEVYLSHVTWNTLLISTAWLITLHNGSKRQFWKWSPLRLIATIVHLFPKFLSGVIICLYSLCGGNSFLALFYGGNYALRSAKCESRALFSGKGKFWKAVSIFICRSSLENVEVCCCCCCAVFGLITLNEVLGRFCLIHFLQKEIESNFGHQVECLRAFGLLWQWLDG